MKTAYGSLWLDQDLPGYTTKDNALLPFVVNSTDRSLLSNETWTTTTTRYSTILACKPAITINPTSGVSYSNGNGCVALAGFETSSNITAWYIGYYMSQYIDYALSDMGCSSEKFSHTSLAYWAETFGNHSNSTALFCEPAYWATKVNATVSAENHTVCISPRRSSLIWTAHWIVNVCFGSKQGLCSLSAPELCLTIHSLSVTGNADSEILIDR